MTEPATHVDTEVVDLSTALEVVTNCSDLAGQLDGQPLGKNKTEQADLNRSLLNLADQLDLAAALARNAYWHSRGGDSYAL